MNEDLWGKFCAALDEGRISVILEGDADTVDGGSITNQLDEVVDFLNKQGE